MPTALEDKIRHLIQTMGPISVNDYFALCLADPEYGYYRTQEPFGEKGDFTTAPEISQLFGEMIGVFLVQAWQHHHKPRNVQLIEIGPGRGTMMADILRVVTKLAPDFDYTAHVHLVETSQRLRHIQQQTLQHASGKITWHETLDSVPDGFTLLVANELFDAIPVRQFVQTASGFKERMVGLDETGALIFAPGFTGLDASLLPPSAATAPLGTIFEISPAREAVMTLICERLKRCSGSALLIDYGHLTTGFGDTLQALRQHRFTPPLTHPGEADLTSHVDFQALRDTATLNGLHVNGCMTQGDFLLGLGILDRAGVLGRHQNLETQAGIETAVNRLANHGEGQMGHLFKAMAVSYPPVHLPPFQAAD